ncbi:MAG: hypothetical protein ABFD49_04900 [Armatimonadota bacterium]
MERSAKKNSLITKAIVTDPRFLGALTPVQRELARRAVWLAVLYGIAQVAGLREWTSALLKGSAASTLERFLCMAYLFLYGSFIFVVPVLVIAVLLLIAWYSLCSMTGRQKQNHV